jgi:hypothetical protein
MLYLSIDLALNKDQRYEDLINDYEEIDSNLLHNLYDVNVFLIIALIIVFSLEIIRVIIRENFAAILFTTTLSIQIDIVWHLVDIGCELWSTTMIGIILSVIFNILSLVFAFMVYLKKNKFNVQKIVV